MKKNYQKVFIKHFRVASPKDLISITTLFLVILQIEI